MSTPTFQCNESVHEEVLPLETEGVPERISLSLSILFGTEQQVAKSAIERYEKKDMKDTE